jgi:hypothetical protein
MRSSQQVYESQDFNNVYLKVKHSMIHQNNLDKIKHRKNTYLYNNLYNQTVKPQNSPCRKKKSQVDLSNEEYIYFLDYQNQLERNNRIHVERLKQISNKEAVIISFIYFT